MDRYIVDCRSWCGFNLYNTRVCRISYVKKKQINKQSNRVWVYDYMSACESEATTPKLKRVNIVHWPNIHTQTLRSLHILSFVIYGFFLFFLNKFLLMLLIATHRVCVVCGWLDGWLVTPSNKYIKRKQIVWCLVHKKSIPPVERVIAPIKIKIT